MSNSGETLLQACAVPLRRCEGEIEVCLITSLGKGRWGVPKGIVEEDQTPQQAALCEAWEEAGLHGEIVGPMLGAYDDRKWGMRLRVQAYLMRVSRADDDWPEASMRSRCWCAIGPALERIGKKAQRRLLRVALERLATDDEVRALFG